MPLLKQNIRTALAVHQQVLFIITVQVLIASYFQSLIPITECLQHKVPHVNYTYKLIFKNTS